MRRRLLNPGPVTLSQAVRTALAESADLCHREPAYAALQTDVRTRLSSLYEAGPGYTTTLITGSGTAAVEAMLGALVPEGATVLIAANGVYGRRMAAMAERGGIDHVVVESGLTDPIDYGAIEQQLDARPGISHIAAVHHETTVGRLNDLARLAAVAGGRPLLVDAVSSFGAEEIRFTDWNVEACAATANKCLHGIPGMAFVVCRRDALAEPRRTPPSVYLDLATNHTAQESGYPQFTPAVQALIALRVALGELEQAGGWRARGEGYRNKLERIRTGLANAGIDTLLAPEDNASSLGSFQLPEGLTFDALFGELSDADFVIYPGQRDLYDRIFRVAVMGDLTDTEIDEFVTTFARVVG